jgi:hypothetical protein
MATKLGSLATAKVVGLLTGSSGVNANVGALTLWDGAVTALVNAAQIRTGNTGADLAERSSTVSYPTVNIYCEKLVNSLTEKFRSFSGTAQMAIEVRNSGDRLEGLQDGLETYTDAVRQVLETNRGDWGDGMFYSGAYQASFGPVKQGGKNFIQTAKITFELGVSRS